MGSVDSMKVAVLISGGVDSSVVLALLKQQGHEITAFYLKIWLEDELSYLGDCPWQEDLSYVEKVCAQFEVPLRIISLQKEYWDQVVSYTIREIKAGRTPNPDLLCNQFIKFGVFFDHIDSSYEKVATGHYAATEGRDGVTYLLRARDAFKDQTYFLAHLSQPQVSRALFPLGGYTKAEVRELARTLDLPNKNRKDSQGICFLGKLKFNDFVRAHVGDQAGDLIEFETGKKLGIHQGFWYYTIGQRRGSGLGGGPWYVVAKDPAQNIVYISNQYFDEQKQRNSFTVSGFNWISGKPAGFDNLEVKIRHGENLYRCALEFTGPNAGRVVIEGQDQGIAPGQFAVFYQGKVCLGCAPIDGY